MSRRCAATAHVGTRLVQAGKARHPVMLHRRRAGPLAEAGARNRTPSSDRGRWKGQLGRQPNQIHEGVRHVSTIPTNSIGEIE